ncbi:class I SAM-dependent methyltransferase [Saccharothrix violaceirubra]|uniref:S-adenosyl-L-methionine-dependent methyltransferase n=1 Tax=Saccharothrix violaceirubra TaxID=413306 RepID=A0A7W7T5Z2_9PSEU|nr:SAM-dependent methyltransferase [Saccharothrix violaceirubra]MBB4965865.1 methyltransferase (TIGR00027 family) [Saccharothrix violaceirubra]
MGDVTGGVGLTALGAAAARAVETSRPDRLAEDPFAAAFVEASPIPVPFPVRWPEDGEELTDRQRVLLSGANYVGLRTRFFDDVVHGARQVVLPAAGLDTRAFRLDWPADAHVYELDLAGVLAFKDAVLTVAPAATRTTVAADLATDDWAAALLGTGFAAATPTTWIVEGLLQYLSADAEVAFLAAVDGLSAPGSTLAVERSVALSAEALRAGGARAGVDLSKIAHAGARPDLAAWLADHGWTTEDHPVGEVAARYGRPLLHPRLAAGSAAPSPAGFTVATKR